jgi:hypothetical protein
LWERKKEICRKILGKTRELRREIRSRQNPQRKLLNLNRIENNLSKEQKEKENNKGPEIQFEKLKQKKWKPEREGDGET